MKLVKPYCLIILGLSLFQIGLYGQFQSHKYLNPIQGNTSHVYNYDIIDGSVSADSTLKVKRDFNEKGRRTLTEIYKNDTLSFSYLFIYEHDTMLTYMENLKGTGKKLVSKSVFLYDERGRLKSQEDVPGRKSEMAIFFEYNKKDQKVKEITRINGAKVTESEFKYNKEGKTKQINQKHVRKGRLLDQSTDYFEYNTSGLTTTTFKSGKNKEKIPLSAREYNQAGQVVRVTKFPTETQRILSINATLEIHPNDIHVVETEWMEDGTPLSEKEYLNDQLIGYQRYFYYRK